MDRGGWWREVGRQGGGWWRRRGGNQIWYAVDTSRDAVDTRCLAGQVKYTIDLQLWSKVCQIWLTPYSGINRLKIEDWRLIDDGPTEQRSRLQNYCSACHWSRLHRVTRWLRSGGGYTIGRPLPGDAPLAKRGLQSTSIKTDKEPCSLDGGGDWCRPSRVGPLHVICGLQEASSGGRTPLNTRAINRNELRRHPREWVFKQVEV